MNTTLPDYPITHAGIKPYRHPQLGVTVNGQTAVRYVRFGQRARIDRLELPPGVYGRWMPAVPTHPAHLIISVFDSKTQRWKTVREVNLPRDPRIEGKGLSQRMTAEQMDTRFAEVLKKKPHVIQLGGLVTDHLRVECDREHPTWPNHGEVNGGEFNVPFGILNPLKTFGKLVGKPAAPIYLPGLKLATFRPRASRGMTVRQLPTMLLFEGRRLSVGFSLKRPMLVHLGWNEFGGATRNRLRDTQAAFSPNIGGISGPVLRTFTLDCQPHHWTGEVAVTGNQIAYRNLHCAHDGMLVDVVFTVEPDRLVVQLRQNNRRAFPAIEAEAWRLVWDVAAAMTGAMAAPTLRPGRNGDVQLPMLWASDGDGCLSCRQLEGNARMQIESHRTCRMVTGSVVFGTEAGKHEAMLELAVTKLQPATKKKPSPGVQSHWGSIYSCFRPELGGFSNNAVSTHCHQNQHCPSELVAFTRKPKHGPNPLDLFRFTIERPLLNGAGYGYFRNLYLDSDPVLVSGAGRIHQVEPNLAWLRRIEPGLLETVQRMLGTIGREGLVICRALSGNAGSFRWSSNAYDVVGFGHMDAYVNACTYRGLRNAAAMLSDLGHESLAGQCRERAAALRTAYPKHLLNPKTKWIAGWRSRDGELHDYAFTWVNGFACALGLLDQPVAHRALTGLEQLRKKVGADSGTFGVPANLLPIRRNDHMLPQAMRYFPTTPTFEYYTDGAMTGHFSGIYLRALAINGLKREAKKLAKDMEAGYAAGVWVGGSGSGAEFHSWDGLCTGYEGTFVGNFGPLYGIAIEQGLFKPTNPEWWPANG